MRAGICHILLTIDVEDWFQVENFKQYISFSSWPSRELRVEKNTHRLLDLLDSIPHSPKATFFVLGWVADRLPDLVREIHGRGHEVASHGYYHKLCSQESRDALRRDLTDSKRLLEDIIGAPVYGYRAPSFSISGEILELIRDCGYSYDSSYNSFEGHSRYGHVDLTGNKRKGIAIAVPELVNPKSKPMHELPISNMNLGRHVLPWGGGGYFRLIPSALFNLGVKRILNKERAYLFYMHPWEIDPGQPGVKEASRVFKFRHYINLNKTESKLLSFAGAFRGCCFITCHKYLKQAVCAENAWF
jgi:polysaccharide deacetylase family protein (PEP-CTERM system associated)